MPTFESESFYTVIKNYYSTSFFCHCNVERWTQCDIILGSQVLKYLIKSRISSSIIYYIDTSVLLGNIPLVKFINATSGTRVVYFP